MNPLDKAMEIIAKSGHDLNFKVKDFLQSKGWEIEMSPHYVDVVTGKTREFDIIAKKEFKVYAFSHNPVGSILIKLFIECKYIKDTTVAWFTPKDFGKVKKIAMDNHLLRHKEDILLGTPNQSTDKLHHYLASNEAVTLVDKAGQYDPIGEAKYGTLHALIYFSENFNNGSHVINFPLIVIDSYRNLFRREGDDDPNPTPITDSFQLEVDYSYPQQNNQTTRKDFLVDVTSYGDLGKYVDYLEANDVKIFTGQLHWDLIQQNKRDRSDYRNSSR